MAIEKRYDGHDDYNDYDGTLSCHYTLVCDHCGAESGHFIDFYDAVSEKKNYGYKSVNINGEWFDICSNCQELAQYKKGFTTAADDFSGIV
jgi:hypothetical protein